MLQQKNVNVLFSGSIAGSIVLGSDSHITADPPDPIVSS